MSKAPDNSIALPFELLLQRLEAAGFRIDPSRRLRLLRALDEQGHHFVGRIDELKYLVAPIVSRSAAEQRKVYEILEAFLAESVAVMDEPAVPTRPGPTAKETGKAPKKHFSWKKLWWILPLAGMLLMLCLRLIDVLCPPQPGGSVLIAAHFNPPPVYADSIAHYTAISTNLADSTLIHWEVIDARTGDIHFREAGKRHLNWKAGNTGEEKLIRAFIPEKLRKNITPDTIRTTVLCSRPPKVGNILFTDSLIVRGQTYTVSIDNPENYPVEWSALDATIQTLNNQTANITFNSEGFNNITARVYYPDKSPLCYAERAFSLNVGASNPVLALAPLKIDTPRNQLKISFPGWGILGTLLLLSGWFFYRWWKRRQVKPVVRTAEELASDYPVHDAGPYFIPYQPQEQKITVPRDFFRTADILRRREADVRTYFDAPASVRATIDAGGFPSWRESALTRPTDYLFLVTRLNENDQQSRLFERLATFMLRRDVPLTVFTHDGYFTRFYNSANPEGFDLKTLRGLYPNHRLVLVGHAHGLIDPYATQQPRLLDAPLRDLQRWPRRLLLTPEPLAAWSFQEALLHRHFLLFPADTEGMLAGFDLLDRTEEYQPGRFERWTEQLRPYHSPENHRYRRWDNAADHADYLSADPEAFRWLCALAVCPQPDWALTIAIGRAIGVEVTHDRLLLLTRIPWLSANMPNDTVRLELLQSLDADTERRARQAVADELEAVGEQTRNSFSDTERNTNLAVQRFALNPRDENAKQTLRELKTLGLLSGSQMAELDHLVRQHHGGKTTGMESGTTLETWLSRNTPGPVINMYLIAGIVCFGLCIALLGIFNRYNDITPATPDYQPAFWQRMVELRDEALELNNRAVMLADSLLALDNYDSWVQQRDAHFAIDSLLNLAIQRRGSEGYPLADSNSHALKFNVAAKNFNYFLADQAQRGSDLQLADEQFGIVEILKRYSPDTSLMLNTLHGKGLCAFYNSGNQSSALNKAQSSFKSLLNNNISNKNLREDLVKQAEQFVNNAPRPTIPENYRDTAVARYNAIVARNAHYFDTLEMPVNLKTLLFPGPPKPETKSEITIPQKRDKIPKDKERLIRELLKTGTGFKETGKNNSKDWSPQTPEFPTGDEPGLRPCPPYCDDVKPAGAEPPASTADSAGLQMIKDRAVSKLLEEQGVKPGERYVSNTSGKEDTGENPFGKSTGTGAGTGGGEGAGSNTSIGGGMSGRKIVSRPATPDDGKAQGKVVMNICIDGQGNVISAEYTLKGSTTSDKNLIQKATEAAWKYKFEPSKDPRQCGTITFDFKKRTTSD